MKIKEKELTEIDLKKRIIECILDKRDFFSVGEILRNYIEQGKEALYFNPHELEWLQPRLELINKIVENKNACGIFYWLKKGEDIRRNFTPYFIAKKLGVYPRSIQYWIRKLQRNGLLVGREQYGGSGNVTNYCFNPKLKGLISLIYEAITIYRGNTMTEIINNDKNKQWESIKKWKIRNPGLVKKHHHNYEKGY